MYLSYSFAYRINYLIYSFSTVSESMSVIQSFSNKRLSESSSKNSAITPQNSLLHAQTMVLDDIENWNPELAVMMTPVEIKKQLIHTRSSKSKSCNFYFPSQII